MQCTEERFLKDVRDHQMTVLRDDGVHRHIRFKRPDSGDYYFDLITWPGFLCYTGDMGTYVFSHIEDMFEFFRIDQRDWNYNRAGGLSINPGYWSEKLQAVARHEGCDEFDADRFRLVVNEYRTDWMRDMRERGFCKDDRRELWEAVESYVLNRADDGEAAAYSAAHEFSYSFGRETFQLEDFYEHRFKRFTFHFVWCCYALAWGVKKYDEERALPVAA